MAQLFGRVGNFVRDAQRNVGAVAERQVAAATAAARDVAQHAGQRTANDIAQELENQARRVGNPQNTAELLARWIERSDGQQAVFSLGGHSEAGHGLSEPLSFYQALLRSQAFEALLDSCGRQTNLRSELLRCCPGSSVTNDSAQPAASDAEADAGILKDAMNNLVDRLLLPGAQALWPGLLEVLLLSAASAEETASQAGKAGGAAAATAPAAATTTAGSAAAGPSRGSTQMPKCGPWARKALQLVKRSWQGEALPAALRSLDRKLTQLATKPGSSGAAAEGETGGGATAAASGADLFRAGGARMSKTAIRAALNRDTLRSRSSEAERLRQSVELLCDACARLEVAQSGSISMVPEAEKLLNDADEMLASLDVGVKELSAEQEDLKTSLSEVSVGLEKQIVEFTETQASMAGKRAKLEEDRAGLVRRLEEVDMQLEETAEVTDKCDAQVKQLSGKVRDTKNLYEEQIAGCFCRQKRLTDEKLRAATCKECAHTALDVIRNEDRRRMEDVQVQLRRRRAELRRISIAYIRQERSRIEAAVDCLGGQPPLPLPPAPAPKAGGDMPAEDPLVEASRTLQDSWKAASAVLRRAEPLLRESGQSLRPAPEQAAGGYGWGGGVEAPLENVNAFFAQEAEHGDGCVDCGHYDAPWASVSHGTYLCVDCAGKHRGLGVHLSFVRSTTMDKWSREQFRRMQVGGNASFVEFLNGYPQLRAASLATKYGSRAAGYYRRLLDARCREPVEEAVAEEAQLPPAPPPAEGHLPDVAATVGQSVVGHSGGSGQGSPSSPGIVTASDGDAEPGSLEEEREALRGLYLKHTRHGDNPGSPVAPSTAAPVAASTTADIPTEAGRHADAAATGAAVAAATAAVAPATGTTAAAAIFAAAPVAPQVAQPPSAAAALQPASVERMSSTMTEGSEASGGI